MPETAKPSRMRTYEAGFNLPGVHLKAIDEHDLDQILSRGKEAANRQAFPLTPEAVRKLIKLLQEL